MTPSPFEAAAAAYLAAHLAANKVAILTDVEPLNIVIAGAGISLADQEAAKLGGIQGWAAKAMVEKFSSQASPMLAGMEGDGFDTLVKFLLAVAAKGATPGVPPTAANPALAPWYAKFDRTPT
jgi:hypothetical protein